MRLKLTEKNGIYLALLIVIFVLSTQAGAHAKLIDGLVAYWPLDEGRGDVMGDAVGENPGEIELDRGVWTDDAQVGKAFELKGQSLITVKNARDLDQLPEGFTIAHWMKPTKGGAIMDKSGGDGTRIQWYLLGDKRHHWGIGGAWAFSDGKPIGNYGKWYHVAWSHEPNESSIVYRDGKEVGNKILGEVPVTGKPMHFGNRLPWEGRSEWFNGTLDEIGFWNRPLSEDEVQEVMESGIGSLLAVSARDKVTTTWGAIKGRSSNPN